MNIQTFWGVLATTSLIACTTTESIDGRALLSLRGHRPSSKSLALETPDGRRVRLDPQSQLSFILKNDGRTEAVPAHEIEVTADGRVRHGKRELAMNDIKTVEVENIDGVKTYFLTVGIVGVAALLVAYGMLDADDGGGSSGGGNAPRITARPAPSGKGPSPGSVRVRPRPRVWVAAAPRVPVLNTYDLTYGYHYGYAYRSVYVEGQAPLPPNTPQKLFTSAAVRRSTFSMILQTDAGFGLDERTGATMGVGAGIAVMGMFEFGGGARFTDVGRQDGVSLAYLRAGGNFPLEAGDVIGAPIHLEVGFNGGGFRQMRVMLGLRFRFSQLELAVLPFNPQLNRLNNDTFWDFPSTVQLAYRF